MLTAEDVYESVVKRLESSEQLKLVERIARELSHGKAVDAAGSPPEPSLWSQLRGRLPYPAYGEDAQAAISRGRRESEEHRERLLRRG